MPKNEQTKPATKRANRKLKHPPRPTHPRDREARPAHSDLAGESEHSLQSARRTDGGEATPPRPPARAKPQRSDPVSARPDDLGRRYLERAAQKSN